MIFPVQIAVNIFLIHHYLFLQQVKCFPDMFHKQAVNLTPSDDYCPKNSLCENPPNYPTENIRQAFQPHSLVFRTKEVENYAPHRNITDIMNRASFNQADIEGELCPSLKKTLRPRQGTTIYNKEIYIVNLEDIFIQEVDVEFCGDTIQETKCRFVEPDGNVRTVCRQHYVGKELIVFENGKLVTQAIKIPSHCCCDISEN
ncbi:uncharacterized protein LOC117181560 [Belonocnema kinseyi]|uniref:uncharacterized protein LOC117181560 n=1 Tax=Belonocnema kinseyi TaxID=2817044 RepID=UPI00143D9665|nr:uncharacterized protein LOC117181560 [Belonocnema kinseyi]